MVVIKEGAASAVPAVVTTAAIMVRRFMMCSTRCFPALCFQNFFSHGVVRRGVACTWRANAEKSLVVIETRGVRCIKDVLWLEMVSAGHGIGLMWPVIEIQSQ
jgi:hypothetical protein